jgi:uncharacterized protein (DUF1778 family)
MTKRKAKADLRSCRFELRLTPAEKKKLERSAKARGCTITSIVSELIEKL